MHIAVVHIKTDCIIAVFVCVCVLVKRDIQDSDEEAVRVKEQSILELGGLLAKTGQAAGNLSRTGVFQSTIRFCHNENKLSVFIQTVRSKTVDQHLPVLIRFFYVLLRARRPAEVCPALPQLHLQGQSSPAGSLPARLVLGHGSSHGSGGGAVPGVHRVGQG